VEVLKPRVPVSRIVFHEITPEAIRAALASPRQIDTEVVRAQETRRILDRLVGYTLSPLLWKKIASGLSAGRVQSVAVRLLVQRERERRAFRSGAYWDLKATLLAGQAPFTRRPAERGGKRVASGRDFDETTGRLKEARDVLLLDEPAARELAARLRDGTWRVARPRRSPRPPSVSALHHVHAPAGSQPQAAPLRARHDARRAAACTRRATSPTCVPTRCTSRAGDRAARARVKQLYGQPYLSPAPRQFTTKSKGAQEAHEAIRPAAPRCAPPRSCGCAAGAALYELIWKRTVASQMADARLTQLTALIEAGDAVFRASGRRIDFPASSGRTWRGTTTPRRRWRTARSRSRPSAAATSWGCARWKRSATRRSRRRATPRRRW
jgi:DNA topoisomerase-1